MTPEDMFFFFSSRRRHTRSLCDWSSDVCSSDLKDGDNILLVRRAERAHTDVERAVVPEDIVLQLWIRNALARPVRCRRLEMARRANQDRKSTRLNSSHTVISYAVFCLKKKKQRTRLLAPSRPA